MKLIIEIEYAKAEMTRDISPSDVLRALQSFCIHKIIAVSEIRPTPVAADGAVAPIKCAECGDEILPICEACAGDMRRR